MSNIEQVGARMVVTNGAKFRADFVSSTKVLAAFNDEQERTAALAGVTSKAVMDASAATAAAVKAGAAASTAAVDEQVAAQERAIAAVKDSQKAVLAAQGKYDAAVVAASAETSAKAVAASNKILKVGAIGAGAFIYEGVKQYMSFQQMISQSAIDAGVKSSQLPAFSKMAIQISNATGMAATSVADMMYRIASANPGLGTTTAAMKAMATQAANLYVLAGATGDPDSIARTYGALVSSKLSLAPGGKALGYSSADAKSINEWILATTGHGDMKTGDLVAALGTGILPVAKTMGLSLNEVGAALDVLSPGMNTSEASTRLKTAFASLATPTQKASQAYELFGGNVTTAQGIMRTKGLGGLLGYLSGMLGGKVNGSTFASAFYGSGLGSITGGTKGMGTGAGEYLRVLGFTPQQAAVMESSGATGFASMSPSQLKAAGFSGGVTGQKAVQIAETQILSGMFGGGRMGAAIMQLVNEQGTYGNKLTQIKGSENPQSYAAAMRIAFKEPIVAWHKFEKQIQNFSITIGRDVTPELDGFMGDLESLGAWFGRNKGALRALEYAGAGLLAGAAVIKTASVISKVAQGGASIIKFATNPLAGLKGIFSSGPSPVAAAEMQLKAAQMQLTAAETALRDKGVPIPGGASAEEAGAEGVGALGVAKILGRGVLKVGTKAGLAALGVGLALNELDKITGFKKIGAVNSNSLLGKVYARSDNIADTALNVISGGLWHPHFNTVDAMSNTQLADEWAKVKPGSVSSAQQAALVRIWQSGEKTLTPAHRNLIGAIGAGSLTETQRSAMSNLQKLASDVSNLAKSHAPAAEKESSAAQDLKAAAALQKQAAELFVTIPAQLAAALSPSAIYAASKTGRQAVVARK